MPQAQSYAFNFHCSFDPPEGLVEECQSLLLSRIAEAAKPWLGMPLCSERAAVQTAFQHQHDKAWLPFDDSLLRYSRIDMCVPHRPLPRLRRRGADAPMRPRVFLSLHQPSSSTDLPPFSSFPPFLCHQKGVSGLRACGARAAVGQGGGPLCQRRRERHNASAHQRGAWCGRELLFSTPSCLDST